MQVQTVFRAGNSNVVAIPKDVARELGFLPGKKVLVEKDLENGTFTIKRVVKSRFEPKESSGVSKEFNKWLEGALKEDAKILDGLA